MTQAAIVRPLDLETLRLAHGDHDTPEDGMCLMEAVAFVAGEPHSDNPKCVSPVLAAFGRRLNDRLTEAERNTPRFKALVLKLPGTNVPELEEARAMLAIDHTLRAHDPNPKWRGANSIPR